MRNTKLAAVPAAILFLGVMSVTACSPRPNQPEASLLLVETPPALETFYVPAQHVNAGAAVDKPVQEYY
jgi:hypothetical protein